MTLDDDDIERIAQRVAELVGRNRPSPDPRYVDAAYLARLLEVERDWVYAHARELGAIRLGGSANGRLRFDLQQLATTLLAPVARKGDGARSTAARPARRRPPIARTDVIQYER